MFPEPGAPNTLSFKVTSIETIACDAPYAPEPNGIPIAISLEIETTADFEGPIIQNGVESGIDFSPYYWTGYADNGTRMNTIDSNITQNCLADETKVLPTWIGKGEKVNGIVVLDVATPTGSIAFDPAGFGGWVWEYPSK